MSEQAIELTADHEPYFHPCPPLRGCPSCDAAEQTSGFDWSFVDAAYCISLRSREDRAASAAAEFHRVGLCRRVTFYRPERHPTKPIRGIWNSHREVALDALRRGHRVVAIFEDDVKFSSGTRPARLRSVAAALGRLAPDWRILYLGHWPLRAWFVGPRLLRTASACTHAYVASPRLLAWLRDNPPERKGTTSRLRMAGTGIDAAYAALPGTFAYFPMIAVQSASPSDHNLPSAGPKRWRLKHVISRSRHREWLQARLIRPNELLIVALSPFFWLHHRLRGGR